MHQVSSKTRCEFEGSLELATLERIEGWARDKNNNTSVMVSIFIDGGLLGTVVADSYREDLKVLGQDCHCGFTVAIPNEYQDGKKHHVRAVILHSDPQFILGDLTSLPVLQESQTIPSPTFFYYETAPHKNTTARAMLGRDGWLFLADDSNRVRDQISGSYPVTPKMKDNFRAVFDERRRRFQVIDVPYLFFIAPTKERICVDRLPVGLPTYFDQMPCNVIQRFLAEDGSDLYALNEAIREEDRQNHTFYRTDTHWNYVGAHRAYQEIIKAASQVVDCGEPYDRSDFSSRVVKNYRGDLANKEKVVFAGDQYPLLSISPTSLDSRALFHEDVEQLIDISGDVSDLEVREHLKVSLTRPTVIKVNKNKSLPKALVFRDSFTTLLAPMLARNFSEIIYVWRPEVLFSLIESEKPDIVLHIMVDRFMVRPQANI